MLPADADFGHGRMDADRARHQDADAQDGSPLPRGGVKLEPTWSRLAGQDVCVEDGPQVVDGQHQIED
jgi:hypothetical protein